MIKGKFPVTIILFSLISMACISGCRLRPDDDKLIDHLIAFSPSPEPDKGYPAAESGDTYSGSAPMAFHVDTSGDVTLTHDLDLGSAVKDVYFVFTNTGTSNSSINPTVNSSVAPDAQDILFDTRQSAPTTKNGKAVYSGKAFIDEFNRDPFSHLSDNPANTGLNRSLMSKPRFDIINSSYSFMYDSTAEGEKIPSTCKKIVTVGGKTLNIWVADDCWYIAGGKANSITQAMVDALADKFLRSGDNNDLNDWITNIYGEEWGDASSFSNLIADNDEITILLYDIDGDDSTTGGCLGFYWNKDNFKATGQASYPFSNERIMFYLDAVMLATPSGTTWEITDTMPSSIVSAAAHEFQHMIHYYQKTVRNGLARNSDTWINEMCSLVTEDFVADKLGIEGPRGVDYSDGSPGGSGNMDGRLPLYNAYNDDSLTYWGWPDGSDDVLRSYSMAYAYGAYLARNFGGASLFRGIVQNENTDSQAITTGFSYLGYTDTFLTSLRKWGAAVLLSDRDNAVSLPAYSRYNNGSNWNSSSINSVSYNLGSINLFNYSISTLNGPYIYSTSPVGQGYSAYMKPLSNRFYRVGTGLTGHVVRTVKMDENVKLTVVVK